MKAQKKKPNIVSVHLAPEAKAALDQACQERGMTIKSLLGRLIEWFNSMNRTEQSIVLGQVEQADVQAITQLLASRHGKNAARKKTTRRARSRR
jgi:hypothetical protein